MKFFQNTNNLTTFSPMPQAVGLGPGIALNIYLGSGENMGMLALT